MIRIRAKKAGFRRCGLAHAREWTEYPDGRFTTSQLEVLRAEPMLQVEVVADTVTLPEPVALEPVPEAETDAAKEAPAAKRKKR